MEEQWKRRWFSSGSDEHAITHEIGHALHDRGLGSHQYQRIRELGFRPEQAKLVKDQVSGYAATEPVEFVAEVYAATKSGTVFSPEILDLYRQLGGPRL